MNIYDFLFITTLFILIGILLYKLYNVFSAVTIYDIRICWLLFIGATLAYGVSFIVSMLDYDKLAYLVLFQLGKLAFLLIVILQVIQVLMYMATTPGEVTAFKSNELKAKG